MLFERSKRSSRVLLRNVTLTGGRVAGILAARRAIGRLSQPRRPTLPVPKGVPTFLFRSLHSPDGIALEALTEKSGAGYGNRTQSAWQADLMLSTLQAPLIVCRAAAALFCFGKPRLRADFARSSRFHSSTMIEDRAVDMISPRLQRRPPHGSNVTRRPLARVGGAGRATRRRGAGRPRRRTRLMRNPDFWTRARRLGGPPATLWARGLAA